MNHLNISPFLPFHLFLSLAFSAFLQKAELEENEALVDPTFTMDTLKKMAPKGTKRLENLIGKYYKLGLPNEHCQGNSFNWSRNVILRDNNEYN